MRVMSRVLGAVVTAAALAAAPLALTASAASAAVTAPAAPAGDGPAGFYYGTDSWPVSGAGSAPYREPVTGGGYGGYIGMAGNWARLEGCRTGNFLAWAPANSAQANLDYTRYHMGIGTGVYWYMGGPGVDPHWNGTAAEASSWGALQAARTLSAIQTGKLAVTYPVIWADIELPGIEPALDNGWNTVYSSPCSERAISSYIPATVDRAEFNGYAAYITAHSKYKVGVYSAAPIWTAIFGTGAAAQIPSTYEWTYLPETANVAAAPVAWCLRGTSACAQFFGGVSRSSRYALMWQWSGGGGVTNGHGDFDQIDIARMR
jgi:hypothetical protein